MTNPEAPHEASTPSTSAETTTPQPAAPAAAQEHAPDASTAAPMKAEEHAGGAGEGAAEAEGEGDGGADAGGEEAGEGAAAGEGGEGGAAAAGPTGEKKKRRRRRRKKHAGAPGEVGAEAKGAEGAPAGEGGEAAPAEGAEGAEAPHGEGKPERHKKKDKEKKHGPPRERPPVNVGDIVFGKILEITDDAILIDIPGKAHAIFDRRELLLPDDDDPRPPRREHHEEAEKAEGGEAGAEAAAAPGAESASASGSESASESGSAAESGSESGSAAESASASGSESASASASESVSGTETGTATAASTEAATSTTPETSTETAASAEAAEGASPPVEAAPEPPKDPKLPRVVLEVGADFIAMVHSDGGRGGLVVLTHHPRRAERSKFDVEKAFNDKTTVLGLVTGVIKGGIEVDLDGLRAFAPGSHVELRLGADLHHLLAKRLPFFVTQYAKRGRDVVLSRKAMLEEEAKKTRAEALSRLKVGEEIEGIVRSVVPFGAFVDIGGIEGLVPLQEMSHNRADGPSDVFKAGQPTRVKVTKIDDKGKIWLSHKATIADPWSAVAQKYAQGTRHTGKVVRLQPFGAFVELEAGVDGLIHLADLSLKRIEGPEEVVKVGDSIDVVVSHVEAGNHRIALHPAPQGDAANEAPQRIQAHKPVKAKVAHIESGGLVVRILGVTGRNARGYITAAGTGTPRGTELRKVFNIGQEVDAKVIEMDPRRGEVKLSIKALSEDQERNAYQQYRQQVKAEAKFTFGDLLKKNPPR